MRSRTLLPQPPHHRSDEMVSGPILTMAVGIRIRILVLDQSPSRSRRRWNWIWTRRHEESTFRDDGIWILEVDDGILLVVIATTHARTVLPRNRLPLSHSVHCRALDNDGNAVLSGLNGRS